MSKPELDEPTTHLVTRLLDLQARIAELKAREDELKSQLRQLGRGDYAYPGGTLKLTQATKFNPEKALLSGLLEPADLLDCTVLRIDPALVKAKLTTEEIQACSEPDGVLRVSIKESE